MVSGCGSSGSGWGVVELESLLLLVVRRFLNRSRTLFDTSGACGCDGEVAEDEEEVRAAPLLLLPLLLELDPGSRASSGSCCSNCCSTVKTGAEVCETNTAWWGWGCGTSTALNPETGFEGSTGTGTGTGTTFCLETGIMMDNGVGGVISCLCVCAVVVECVCDCGVLVDAEGGERGWNGEGGSGQVVGFRRWRCEGESGLLVSSLLSLL